MQIIIQPLPRIHLLHTQPRFPIRKRREEQEAPNQHGDNNAAGRPGGEQRLPNNPLTNGSSRRRGGFAILDYALGDIGGFDIEDELNDGAGYESGGEVGREVVVEEELATHDEEGDIVGCPKQEEETCAVVEAGAGA